MPAVSASAARDAAGQVHVALVNLDPSRSMPVSARLAGLSARAVSGRIVTAPEMDAAFSFVRPDRVAPAPFADARINGDRLEATLPPKSVVMLDLR